MTPGAHNGNTVYQWVPVKGAKEKIAGIDTTKHFRIYITSIQEMPCRKYIIHNTFI